MDCIILAGGLGTRLSSVVSDKPKCMADVNGQPFLNYILEEIESQGVVDHVILSLGHMHQQVIDWLKSKAFLFKVSWVIEKELKGTGGAIRYALQKSKSGKVFIINGDTYFNIDWTQLVEKFDDKMDIILALREVENANRYGQVELEPVTHQILSFHEKSADNAPGFINGGVSLINKTVFDKIDAADPFSFETVVLPQICSEGRLYGHLFNDYFIDIGIPEDYQRFIDKMK